jgi:hypothetical protein
MKNLILITLTLISLNSFSQRYYISSIGDTSYHYISDKDIINVLIKEYSKYETELCDSSVVWCYVPLVGKTDLLYTDYVELKEEYPNGISDWFEYKCKQPTFPDFMEWLKTKYEL